MANTHCITTGIQAESNYPQSTIVYPNPSSGIFYFNNIKAEIQTIEVYNYLGEKVFTSVGPAAAIDITDAVAGIYFVQVKLKTGEATFSTKVVKE